MAVLSNADFTEIKQNIASNVDIKSTFKTWGLSKQVWKDTFQAAEDWFVNGFTVTPTNSFKASLEVVAGAMTNAQAKAIGRAWMSWRFDKDI